MKIDWYVVVAMLPLCALGLGIAMFANTDGPVGHLAWARFQHGTTTLWLIGCAWLYVWWPYDMQLALQHRYGGAGPSLGWGLMLAAISGAMITLLAVIFGVLSGIRSSRLATSLNNFLDRVRVHDPSYPGP